MCRDGEKLFVSYLKYDKSLADQLGENWLPLIKEKRNNIVFLQRTKSADGHKNGVPVGQGVCVLFEPSKISPEFDEFMKSQSGGNLIITDIHS